eukprot:Awhi_evm1s2504
MNKVLIALDVNLEIKEIKLKSAVAVFYTNPKSSNLYWKDYVTMNTGFDNGFNSGTNFIAASSIENVGGHLVVSPKQNLTLYSNFQILPPTFEE